MTHPFRRVLRGQRFEMPADAYNAFVDAAEAHRMQREGVSAQRGRLLTPGAGGRPNLVLVRNESEEDLPRFGVLGIEGVIIEPGPPEDGYNTAEFARLPAIRGAAITWDDPYAYHGRFVIAREPIAAGKIGYAVILGITPAIVIISDEAHTCADTAPGNEYLQSGFAGGARILWKQAPDAPLPDGVLTSGGGEARFALLEVGPRDRDRLAVRLGKAQPIAEDRWGWKYPWSARELDGDPTSPTYGMYLMPPDPLTDDGIPERMAINRFEAGAEGNGGDGGGLVLPPIREGTIVELRAERTWQGDSRFVFEAPTSALFTAIITGNDYGAWPRAYTWQSAMADGPHEVLDPNGFDWEDFAWAHNQVEMATGFGSVVSPYGGQMSDEIVEVEVLPIPNGQPVRMWIAMDGLGNPWPRFSAPNALKVTCKSGAKFMTTTEQLNGDRSDAAAPRSSCGGCS